AIAASFRLQKFARSPPAQHREDGASQQPPPRLGPAERDSIECRRRWSPDVDSRTVCSRGGGPLMKRLVAALILLALGLAVFVSAPAAEEKKAAGGPMIVHDVYFTLNDNSAEAKKKLVAACKKYLTKHPGEVFFAAGTLADDLNRPVNDRDFDVGLHIVFKDKVSLDKYVDAERHMQFSVEYKGI